MLSRLSFYDGSNRNFELRWTPFISDSYEKTYCYTHTRKTLTLSHLSAIVNHLVVQCVKYLWKGREEVGSMQVTDAITSE